MRKKHQHAPYVEQIMTTPCKPLTNCRKHQSIMQSERAWIFANFLAVGLYQVSMHSQASMRREGERLLGNVISLDNKCN